MFKKIRNRVKNFLSPIFKSRDRELGFACAGICVGLIALVAGGVTLYFFSGDILKGLAGAVTNILLILSTWALKFSGEIFTTVAGSEFVSSSITKAEIVKHGWRIIRDLANMGIVLGFVVVE